jgi:hypothetical protein
MHLNLREKISDRSYYSNSGFLDFQTKEKLHELTQQLSIFLLQLGDFLVELLEISGGKWLGLRGGRLLRLRLCRCLGLVGEEEPSLLGGLTAVQVQNKSTTQ